jgi:hypothetical protein
VSAPDVLALVIDGLDLPGVVVTSRRPDPMPETLVQLRLSGGAAVVPVRYRATIDVYVWAPTEPAAVALALTIRQQLWSWLGGAIPGSTVPLYRLTEVQAPRVIDDPITDRTRAWGVYQLLVRDDTAVPANA